MSGFLQNNKPDFQSNLKQTKASLSPSRTETFGRQVADFVSSLWTPKKTYDSQYYTA